MKTFRVGDRIHLPDGSRGTVEEIENKQGNIKYPYQYLFVDIGSDIVGVKGYLCHDPEYIDESRKLRDGTYPTK